MLHHETSSLVLATALCIGLSLVAMHAGCADASAPHNVRLIGTLTMCLHSTPSRSGPADGHTLPHYALDYMLEPDMGVYMTVQWTTRDSAKPAAMWGTSANSLTNTVNATSKTYTAVGQKLVSCTVCWPCQRTKCCPHCEARCSLLPGAVSTVCSLGCEQAKLQTQLAVAQADMCGAPAATDGWVDPGTLHVATLTGLQPDTTFFYQYGQVIAVSVHDACPCSAVTAGRGLAAGLNCALLQVLRFCCC